MPLPCPVQVQWSSVELRRPCLILQRQLSHRVKLIWAHATPFSLHVKSEDISRGWIVPTRAPTLLIHPRLEQGVCLKNIHAFGRRFPLVVLQSFSAAHWWWTCPTLEWMLGVGPADVCLWIERATGQPVQVPCRVSHPEPVFIKWMDIWNTHWKRAFINICDKIWTADHGNPFSNPFFLFEASPCPKNIFVFWVTVEANSRPSLGADGQRPRQSRSWFHHNRTTPTILNLKKGPTSTDVIYPSNILRFVVYFTATLQTCSFLFLLKSVLCLFLSIR